MYFGKITYQDMHFHEQAPHDWLRAINGVLGWKCRACGSWDVFAAMIGEDQDAICNELKQRVSFKDSIFDVSLSLGKKSGSKECLGGTPCYNKFKVLRDLLENYPSFDCDCGFPCSSLFVARILKSSLNNVE